LTLSVANDAIEHCASIRRIPSAPECGESFGSAADPGNTGHSLSAVRTEGAFCGRPLAHPQTLC